MPKSRNIFLIAVASFFLLLEGSYQLLKYRAVNDGMSAEQFFRQEIETLNIVEGILLSLAIGAFLSVATWLIFVEWGALKAIKAKFKSTHNT
jgi:hypothetical protein